MHEQDKFKKMAKDSDNGEKFWQEANQSTHEKTTKDFTIFQKDYHMKFSFVQAITFTVPLFAPFFT